MRRPRTVRLGMLMGGGLAAVLLLYGTARAARANPRWAAAAVNAAHAVHLLPYRAVVFRRAVATPYPARPVPDPLLPAGLHQLRTPGRSGLLLQTGIALYPAPFGAPRRAAASAGAGATGVGARRPAAARPSQIKVFTTETLAAPRAAVVSVGTAHAVVQVNGRFYHFSRELEMTATAYSANWASNGPYTGEPSAIGLPLNYGIVAVDPHVIALGSRLDVQGYGLAVAADTGSAIVGDRIDLFFWNSPAGIAAFGIRHLKVYVLDDPRLPPVHVPAALRRAFGSAPPPSAAGASSGTTASATS